MRIYGYIDEETTSEKTILKSSFARPSAMGFLLVAVLWCPRASATPKNSLCPLLRAFVASVPAKETRKLEFHTSWGGGFKNDTGNSLFAKNCVHNGYAPAKVACDDLMVRGQVEFAGNNAVAAITCLSPGTRFGQWIDLGRIDMTFPYRASRQARDVTIQFDEDTQLGGMVLTVAVSAY